MQLGALTAASLLVGCGAETEPEPPVSAESTPVPTPVQSGPAETATTTATSTATRTATPTATQTSTATSAPGPYDRDYFVAPAGSYWTHPNWRPSYPEYHGGLRPLYYEGSLNDPGPLQAAELIYLRRYPYLSALGLVSKERRLSRNSGADVYSAGHCADNVLLNISRPEPSRRRLLIEGVPVDYDIRQGLGVAEMAPIVPGRIQEGDAGFRRLFLDYSQTPKVSREPFGAKMKVDSSGLWYRVGIGISRRPIEGEFQLLLIDNWGEIFTASISRVEYLFRAVRGDEGRNPNLDLEMDSEPLRSIYREIYYS